VTASRAYALRSAVRHAEVDGLRVVLDLRTETYRVLDDVASAWWAVLIGEARAADALAELAARYDVGDDRLRADLTAFARRCTDEGLLECADATRAANAPVTPAGTARGGRPTAVRAFVALFATQRALARDGFRATYERYARLPAGSPAPALGAALATFVRAENLFIARRAPDDCLMRSLALFRYLRSVNVAAEHVIGVRRIPFAAHAWVECGGVPALEDRSHAFTPLARIGGSRSEPGPAR
jgi:hypothetical protein